LEELYLFPAFSFHAVIDILQTRQDSGFSLFLVGTIKGIQGDIDMFATFPISGFACCLFIFSVFSGAPFSFRVLG
jgi:hypothetical protein